MITFTEFLNEAAPVSDGVKTKLIKDVQSALAEVKKENPSWAGFVREAPIITSTKTVSCRITLLTTTSSRSVRKSVLLGVFDKLTSQYHYELIKHGNFNNGENMAISLRGISPQSLVLVCKPSKSSTQLDTLTNLNTQDYFGESETELVSWNGDDIPCQKYENGFKFKNSILSTVKSSKKFNDVQKDIITQCLNIKKYNTSGIKIKGVELYPNLLASFGEVLIPYWLLSNKLNFNLPDQGINTKDYSKTIYFPTSANNAKIDYIIKLVKSNDVRYIGVSAKYGRGHTPSIAAIFNTHLWEKVFGNEMNSLEESPLTRLYEHSKHSKQIAGWYWDYYLGSIKINNKNYTGAELYSIFSHEKTFDDKLAEGFKEVFKQQLQSKFSQIKNWMDFYNKFPYSVSYACSKQFAFEMEKSRAGQSQLLTVIGHVPYVQIRIEESSANSGILKIGIEEISPKRKLKFNVPHGQYEINMKHGSVGYAIV